VRARGFTLVEVMVALAIVAITLPALLMALYQQVDDAAYLRDKTQAELVALNKLAEMRLVVASTRNLQAGKDNGDIKFAERDWFWWAETKATEVPDFYRVDIRVALDEERGEQPLYNLSAFIFGDLAIDPNGLQGTGGGGDQQGESDGGTSNGGTSNGGTGDTSGSGTPTNPAIPPGLDMGNLPDGQ
jgi:general secretion pathway protein I